jgi:hypothetical protein
LQDLGQATAAFGKVPSVLDLFDHGQKEDRKGKRKIQEAHFNETLPIQIEIISGLTSRLTTSNSGFGTDHPSSWDNTILRGGRADWICGILPSVSDFQMRSSNPLPTLILPASDPK